MGPGDTEDWSVNTASACIIGPLMSTVGFDLYGAARATRALSLAATAPRFSPSLSAHNRIMDSVCWQSSVELPFTIVICPSGSREPSLTLLTDMKVDSCIHFILSNRTVCAIKSGVLYIKLILRGLVNISMAIFFISVCFCN